MGFEAVVRASAISCSLGEAMAVVSENPGGASSAMRASPIGTATGAATAPEETQASSQPERRSAARTTAILSPAYHRQLSGDKNLGGDPQRASQRAEDRHCLLGRPRPERSRALDAREGRAAARVHGEPRP